MSNRIESYKPSALFLIQTVMILFEYPQIQQEELEQQQTHRIYIKISLLIFLRILIILANLFTVNQDPHFLIPTFASFAIFIVLEFLIFIAYKAGFVQLNLKHKQNSPTEASSQQSSTQFSQQNAQNNKSIKWLPNIFWHLVLLSNIITMIFAISCTMEPVLSSYIHKIRGILYFVVFFCLLGIAYWANNPYLHNYGNGKSINYLLIIKKYEQTQIGFLKYLYICYTMGALIDFLLYGTSDVVSFKISGSMETLNIATVALSLLGLFIAIFFIWVKKYQVVKAVKDIISTE